VNSRFHLRLYAVLFHIERIPSLQQRIDGKKAADTPFLLDAGFDRPGDNYFVPDVLVDLTPVFQYRFGNIVKNVIQKILKCTGCKRPGLKRPGPSFF